MLAVRKCYIASDGTSVDSADLLIQVEMTYLLNQIQKEWTGYHKSVDEFSTISGKSERNHIDDLYVPKQYLKDPLAEIDADIQFMSAI